MNQTVIPAIDETLAESAKRIEDCRPPTTFRQPQASRKQDFLLSLRSTGKLEYKRYMASPLRYAGGKSLAVGFVFDLLPDNLQRIVSPFMGGGAIEIACANELGLEVVAYDVFAILTNYWRIQLKHPERLASLIRKWLSNKSAYVEVKKRLKAHWDGSKPVLDEGKNRVDRLINRVASFRCLNLSVQCGSFEHTIVRHNNDFLYCDPLIIGMETAGCSAPT